MHSPAQIVINTSPLIALVAANGDLKILQFLYQDIFVPFEVCQEIIRGGKTGLGLVEFQAATWLKKESSPLTIMPFLLNCLDLGRTNIRCLKLSTQFSLLIGSNRCPQHR